MSVTATEPNNIQPPLQCSAERDSDGRDVLKIHLTAVKNMRVRISVEGEAHAPALIGYSSRLTGCDAVSFEISPKMVRLPDARDAKYVEICHSALTSYEKLQRIAALLKSEEGFSPNVSDENLRALNNSVYAFEPGIYDLRRWVRMDMGCSDRGA